MYFISPMKTLYVKAIASLIGSGKGHTSNDKVQGVSADCHESLQWIF